MGFARLLFAGAVAAVVIVGFKALDQGAATSDSAATSVNVAASAAPSPPKPPPAWKQVTLAKYDVRKDGFGTVAIGDFTLQNDNSFAVKDVLLACTFYGASGTGLTERTVTIYETIPAKKSKRSKNINVGFIHQQAQTTSCRVVDVSPAT
jgi:hypothetical protein